MSWPNFLSPYWGLLGLLAVPLIALYLLRQKRPDMPISSTLLWSKTLADMRASTPFQKLRRNLLLLLQLLILLALVFTRMRPVVQAQATSSRAGAIVIDAGATMQATDNGGPSRLDRAKIEAHKLVDSMRAGDRFMLLADGGGMNKVLSDFISDKTDLHRLIDQIKPSDTTTDLSETLLLGASKLRSIGNPAGPRSEALVAGKIWLISDGSGVRLPAVPELDRMLQYVKIGESSRNVGIVRLAITPVPKSPRTYQVFAGILNGGKEPRTIPVGLAYGAPDKFVDVKSVTIPAGAQAAAIFQVTLDPGRIWVQLDGKDDDLKLDNTAYGLLEPPEKVRVILVSAGNAVLERFLRTAAVAGEIEGQIIEPARYKPELAADLVIFDSVTPVEMPKCDALLIRPGASVAGFKVVGELDKPPVLRWKRDDPVMAYVEMGDVRISKAIRLERDLEANELIASPEGPLLVAKDAGAARRYLLAFNPLLESNWWVNPSLLIFLENVVEQTRSRHFIGKPQMVAAGQPARLWDLGPNPSLVLPTGEAIEGSRLGDLHNGATEYADTDRVGFYEVRSGDKHATFAVNLFSQQASSIEPKSLENSGGGNVQEATSVAMINREIWPWLAAAALAVLMVEWFVYHRRIS